MLLKAGEHYEQVHFCSFSCTFFLSFQLISFNGRPICDVKCLLKSSYTCKDLASAKQIRVLKIWTQFLAKICRWSTRKISAECPSRAPLGGVCSNYLQRSLGGKRDNMYFLNMCGGVYVYHAYSCSKLSGLFENVELKFRSEHFIKIWAKCKPYGF